ncbi:putative ATP-binding cassette transporter [Aspergillus sclerotioniger CBS 115572]|uniref:Putative ATP-binding cassette transporter n=1 Tax=Aspergillus sclerotioniger CBS 115572 TaxID=1450535 RepID=A0A317WPW6_9EURO|nr:putative ATP-binding cassette transporter [Aspergillus sclerotioniger CBS 115572]PWY88085.1 putative ATP-binding cassette transporter [Aspergillus sclerotioniger CBS 115572]
MAFLGLDNPWESVSLILSVIFLLAFPRRIRNLLNSPKKSSPGRINRQIIFALLLLTIELAVVTHLWPHQHNINNLTISDAYLSTIAAVGILTLAVLEHTRSAHPSSIIPIYLILSRLRDICEILTGNCTSNCHLVNLRACLGGVWLAWDPQLREWIWYQTVSKPSTSEEGAGFLSRVFFCWISPVLKEGYKATLSLAGLPEIHSELLSERIRGRVVREWDSRAEPVTKWTLPVTLIRCLKDAFLSPIIPRLFVILFRYIQPIFMGAAIRFVRGPSETDDGRQLILYAAGIYVGMAVSSAVYQQQINRLKIMVRGALISLIHNQSLNIPNTGVSDAVTLMSSDVDSVESTGEIFHETWAQLLEVIVGTVLLAARIQWFALLPLVIIFGCSRMSAYVAKHLDGRQKAWNVATQERISTITASLGGIKSLKMMGMEDAIESRVTQLRDSELRMSERLRWILVAYNASANALGIFAPVVTLILYASSQSEVLRANEVFTSIALLAMVTHPANMVMTLIPRAVAVMAVFGRIQAYLVRSSVRDARVCSDLDGQSASMDNVSIQPSCMPRPILQDVCLNIKKGEMVVCAGAVGSGKTTLAMALLGETPLTTGSIRMASKKIAYCAQAPWLPSVTIREAISGGFDLDYVWYKTVLGACSLVPDLEALPSGDRTLIENNGINLSGGQRQRIALARAVYSRYDTLILDDPFSALDGAVTDRIVGKLLGPGGLFKTSGTTVFLISNSTRLHPFADKLLVLRDYKAYLQDYSFQHEWIASATTEVTQPKDTQGKGPSQKQRLNEAADDISRRTGDMAIYGYYLNAVGLANVLVMTGCTATYSFGLTFSQYILKWATESPSDELHGYLALYAGISFMAWAATSAMMWSTQMKIAIHSGMVLHAQLLARVLRAPLAYFTETDIGSTLNRFAQDITLIDKQLPPALANLNTQIFKLLMQIILILYVQPIMIVTVPICFLCVYVLQRIYLRTSRQLRFLDLESRSELYTSFLDTTNGITTIRAFNWQNKFTSENIQALDQSQKPFYLLLCLQCWLKVILDCLIVIVVVILMTLTVMYRNTTTGADIGLALNLIIVANTTLLRLVQNWTSLETSLGAISRLKSVLEHVPSEDRPLGTLDPDPQWPRGDVRMDDVSVSYSHTFELAMKNVSLQINPGQKVIVMGRTGSGKTTLILTLLQLLPTRTGSIQIDNIDITRIPLSTLRQRGFIAVPQDGFIIPTATLRFNLDPYHVSTDQAIAAALKRTHLWEKISTSPLTTQPDHKSPLLGDINLLDRAMSTFLPLSAGQLQLFALCRTLLRVQTSGSSRPIVVLDEASSSLDPETEGILGRILKEELREYTVVMIAHRVEGIRDVMRSREDAIITMKRGEIEKVESI